MLNAHFVCGDGRCNENIALTRDPPDLPLRARPAGRRHQEHAATAGQRGAAALGPVATAPTAAGTAERRAAVPGGPVRHRDGVPAPGLRGVRPQGAAGGPAVPRVLAGHQPGDRGRVRPRGLPFRSLDARRHGRPHQRAPVRDNSLPLLTAFLNPPEYFNGGTAGTLTPQAAAGQHRSWARSDQVGNELDEFVTETLRNNLLGLPLDLPTLNMTRAREAGVPPLNDVRRQIFAQTNDGQLAPVHQLERLRPAPQAPGVADQLRGGLRPHPSITSQTHPGRQAGGRAGDRRPGASDRHRRRHPAGRRRRLHVRHRRLGQHAPTA